MGPAIQAEMDAAYYMPPTTTVTRRLLRFLLHLFTARFTSIRLLSHARFGSAVRQRELQ
jgi:hypothetical protein